MTDQYILLPKKRGRPATGRGHTIGVLLQPDALAELDDWISLPKSELSRPEAIRLLIAKGVGKKLFKLLKKPTGGYYQRHCCHERRNTRHPVFLECVYASHTALRG